MARTPEADFPESGLVESQLNLLGEPEPGECRSPAFRAILASPCYAGILLTWVCLIWVSPGVLPVLAQATLTLSVRSYLLMASILAGILVERSETNTATVDLTRG